MSPTIACPEPGIWRAWLDGEAALVGAEEHLEVCAACARAVARLRTDAAATAAALAVLNPPAAPAQQPLHADVVGLPSAGRRSPYRWLTAAAGVLVALAVVVTPMGRSAASAFLAMFRSEQVSVVDVAPGDAEAAITVMHQLGEVDGALEEPTPQKMGSVAAAEAAAGFTVVVPNADELPAGVSGAPRVHLVSGHDLGFTFDAARTRAYLKSQDASARIPAGYDGARLVVHVPSAVVLDYGGDGGLPGLVVAAAAPVTADVRGEIGLAALREFLLGLPGLPDRLAGQLRAIDDWTATLPVPVPVDLVRAEETTVAGYDGLVAGQAGLGAGLVWHQRDRIVAVAGPHGEDEMRRLAEALAHR